MLSQYFKGCFDMIDMCFPIRAISQYIIEENQDKLADIRVKVRVYKSLKCRGGIAKTKGYNQISIMSIMSTKCSFMRILGVCIRT